MTVAEYAVKGLKARSAALTVAELSPLTVMELIDHLDLPTSPYLAIERQRVSDWARLNGIEKLRAALATIGGAR